MVSVGSILAMIFTLTAAFFLPIIGAVVLCAAGRLSWRSLITGFFFYAVLQALFRLPVLWLIYKIPAVQSFAYSLVGNALLMAITTAFFETAARFLGGRLVLGRKGRSITPSDSIGYGLGYSIAETFFLMGLSYFGNLMLAFALNQNGLSNYSEVFGQEAAVQVYQVLTGTPAPGVCRRRRGADFLYDHPDRPHRSCVPWPPPPQHEAGAAGCAGSLPHGVRHRHSPAPWSVGGGGLHLPHGHGAPFGSGSHAVAPSEGAGHPGGDGRAFGAGGDGRDRKNGSSRNRRNPGRGRASAFSGGKITKHRSQNPGNGVCFYSMIMSSVSVTTEKKERPGRTCRGFPFSSSSSRGEALPAFFQVMGTNRPSLQ